MDPYSESWRREQTEYVSQLQESVEVSYVHVTGSYISGAGSVCLRHWLALMILEFVMRELFNFWAEERQRLHPSSSASVA
jgi:hypothetical protein